MQSTEDAGPSKSPVVGINTVLQRAAGGDDQPFQIGLTVGCFCKVKKAVVNGGGKLPPGPIGVAGVENCVHVVHPDVVISAKGRILEIALVGVEIPKIKSNHGAGGCAEAPYEPARICRGAAQPR